MISDLHIWDWDDWCWFDANLPNNAILVGWTLSFWHDSKADERLVGKCSVAARTMAWYDKDEAAKGFALPDGGGLGVLFLWERRKENGERTLRFGVFSLQGNSDNNKIDCSSFRAIYIYQDVHSQCGERVENNKSSTRFFFRIRFALVAIFL